MYGSSWSRNLRSAPCSESIIPNYLQRRRDCVSRVRVSQIASLVTVTEQTSYPLRKEIVPIWLAALLAVLVPIIFILIAQIRVRSFWDVNNAIVGLLYSVITAAVFQVWLKWLIGGLRPHFLTVCNPNVTAPGDGFLQVMYDRSVCTGDPNTIDDSLESFPSGHTTAAFGGFVYLYLYLNAKLKVWSNYHPAFWKMIVTYMPILGATLIGGAL